MFHIDTSGVQESVMNLTYTCVDLTLLLWRPCSSCVPSTMGRGESDKEMDSVITSQSLIHQYLLVCTMY